MGGGRTWVVLVAFSIEDIDEKDIDDNGLNNKIVFTHDLRLGWAHYLQVSEVR